MTETYYDILEVDEEADEDEIESAYREKLQEYHPDVSDHPNARERFLKVKEAQKVLTDSGERQKYDRVGHEEYVSDGRTESRTETDDEQSSDDRTEERREESSDSRRREERRQGGDDRSSAAREYRQRRREATRRDRTSNRGGRGRTGGRQQQTESEADARTSDADRDRRDDSDSDTAETADEEESTQDRNIWQPAGTEVPVDPDIELLKYPAVAVYYFLAYEFNLNLIMAAVLVPIYVAYRRRWFTSQFVRAEVIDDITPEMHRNAVVSAGLGGVFALGTIGALLGGVYAPHAAPLLVLGALGGLGILASQYYISQFVLYQWYEAVGTSAPTAWDLAGRLPIVLLPLLATRPEAVPGFPFVAALLLGGAAAVPLVYLSQTELGIDFRNPDTEAAA